jgi:parallel beta-helix repeat protein
MKKRLLYVTIFLISFMLVGIQPAFSQDDPALHEPGTVEGTGTYFQVTDSEYLNVTLLSTEPIDLILESAPRMIMMEIEVAEGIVATQTLLTLYSLEPSSTYYKYQDDYHNLQTLTTDAEGTVTFLQDLSQLHFVFIQTQHSTKFIKDNSTGGDCTSIGTWNSGTRTCTLTTDVNETIQIDNPRLTLDGNGHTVEPSDPAGLLGVGVTAGWHDYVTVKNLNVKSCTYGIRFSGDRNTISANTVSNIASYGIWSDYTYYATIADNTVSGATNNGFRIKHSRYSNVMNNTATNCGTAFAFKYYGHHTVIQNTAYNNNWQGIALVDSPYNIVHDNTIYNSVTGIYLGESKMHAGANYNKIHNNCIIDNVTQVAIIKGIGNLFNQPSPIGGNYWSDYAGTDTDNDGFGDAPYIFSGGQDNLPLIQECGELPNDPPVADPNDPYTDNEGSPVTFDGTGSSDPDDDPLTYDWNFGDGNTGTGETFVHTYADNGEYEVCLTVTDPDGLADTQCTTATIANVAPTVEAITPSLALVEVGTPINATANFTDPGTDDTHTAEWNWNWPDGTSVAGSVTQGTGSSSVADPHTYTTPGVYTIELTVSDDDGGEGTSVFQYVVVYDPAGGFVTGGGWIDSPEGAYAADSELTGKANFGFVSKYKKGATIPTGNTEFQFKAGDLNFHSDDYEWLVVTGSNYAMFKGEGTINGGGDYKFKLWAGDDEPDTFRIKIWEEDEFGVETVTYDNGMDQAIGGGSIKVHTK